MDQRQRRGAHETQTQHPFTRQRGPASPCQAASPLLTAQEVADRLGVTADWVYDEARADRIPHVRLGRNVRFDADAIHSWLRAIERGSVA
jgi:excisionase family DNA binding protein